MVERVPQTSGHARTVAFVPQTQKEAARGRIAGRSTPSFRAVGDEIVQGDDVVDFGGNLPNWRS
jgi:hypothetical protein